jgi:hypothetical protein
MNRMNKFTDLINSGRTAIIKKRKKKQARFIRTPNESLLFSEKNNTVEGNIRKWQTKAKKR